jgi:hypothetical protein
MASSRKSQTVRKKKTRSSGRASKVIAEKKTGSKVKQSIFKKIHRRVIDFLSRRPHRSFRRTRRRDYVRSLQLPGYWEFTSKVVATIWKNKKFFLILTSLYIGASLLLLGLGSQESFATLRETISEAGASVYAGDLSKLGEASLLALSTVAGSISPTLTEVQQVYAVIIGLLAWLTIVWFLRQRLAGGVVKVRDALYNAGAPIVPMTVLFVILLLQLLPIALALIGYSAAQASGLLDGGVEAMLFWVAAAGLTTLSLYWIASTALALVVVTLPGMYPMRALRIAGDMVVGRRLRILYRMVWMVVGLAVAWVITLIPIILLDTGIKQLLPSIEWLPVVPFTVLLLSCISFIWMASYIYLLYWGIIDDDAKPA